MCVVEDVEHYNYLGLGSRPLCWKDEKRSVIRSTLATFCLVSHEWNRIFTPVLYDDIDIDLGEKSFLTQSHLCRTLRYTRPAHKALVKTMTIIPVQDGSAANLLSICFTMPNLRTLILKFDQFDPAVLHPNFAQHLLSLSKRCTIQMQRSSAEFVQISWERLSICMDFIRRSRLTQCRFLMGSSSGG